MGTMMRSGLLASAVVLIAILAGVTVACGGGNGEGIVAPSPSAAATPLALEGQLKGMVLQPSDVPAGFSLTESFSTNEDVAGSGDDAETVLAKLTQWGRTLGLRVVFSPEASDESGIFLVDSSVSLYESDSGAAASFADARNTASATDWSTNVEGTKDVRVEEIPPLDVADEMLWLRISGTAIVGEPATEQAFVQDVVLLRVGRARATVSVGYSGADASQAAENMVRAQAARMAAGLR